MLEISTYQIKSLKPQFMFVNVSHTVFQNFKNQFFSIILQYFHRMAEQRTSFDNYQSKDIGNQQVIIFPNEKLGHSAVELALPSSKQQIERVQNNYGRSDETLQKFIRFTKFHAIEPFDIWEDGKPMSVDDFAYRVECKLGYRFSQLQRLCLMEMTKDCLLKQESFIDLGLWNKKSKINLMTSISQKSILQIKKRRIITAKPQTTGLANSKENQIISKTPRSKQQMLMKISRESLTKTFLRTGLGCSNSQDLKLEALRSDLEMNALEKKWEFVVMAGEMNKWIEESRSEEQREDGVMPPKFKVINRRQNFILLRVDGEDEEVIPEVVFLKKYNALKKKHPSGQSQCKPVKKIQKNPQQPCIKAPVSRLNPRDHELNEALLHIMRVKNILQFQYRILTETAINT